MCVLTFFSSSFVFLIEMIFSFKSLFAIWLLSPQRFHSYFFLVSRKYQKYSTILILVLCLLCVTAVGLLILPVSTFLQQLMTKKCELFTHTLVLQCSPSTLSHQPQTIHVFADSRIALLCCALRICVTHAPTESCPFSLLVR